MLIGGHFPISGGINKALELTMEAHGNTVQIFTKSPGQWKSRVISNTEAEEFKRFQNCSAIRPVIVHASYLINLASGDDNLRSKSIRAMIDEILRAELVGGEYVIIHMGAHLEQTVEKGLRDFAGGIEECLESTQNSKVMILLETTAGMGTQLGWKFEQVSDVMRMCSRHPRIGVCVDTCHIFAAGYDIRDIEGYRRTFHDFDRIIGLENLRVIHMNDSKKPLGSRIDRHEYIGEGFIGTNAFAEIMNDPIFENIPLILETPNPEVMHKQQIKFLLSLKK
jgi:deoxyribonuclease IV